MRRMKKEKKKKKEEGRRKANDGRGREGGFLKV